MPAPVLVNNDLTQAFLIDPPWTWDGPFFHGTDRYFAFQENDLTSGVVHKVVIYKSTDSGVTWNVQDYASATNIRPAHGQIVYYVSGTVIHWCYRNNGAVYIRFGTFDMATDTYGAVVAVAGGPSNASGTIGIIQMVVLDNGDRVLIYENDIMNGLFTSIGVYYAILTSGGAWTNVNTLICTNLEAMMKPNGRLQQTILAADGRVWVLFCKSDDSLPNKNTLYARAFDPGTGTQSVIQTIYTPVTAGNVFPLINCVSRGKQDSTTGDITFPFFENIGPQPWDHYVSLLVSPGTGDPAFVIDSDPTGFGNQSTPNDPWQMMSMNLDSSGSPMLMWPTIAGYVGGGGLYFSQRVSGTWTAPTLIYDSNSDPTTPAPNASGGLNFITSTILNSTTLLYGFVMTTDGGSAGIADYLYTLSATIIAPPNPPGPGVGRVLFPVKVLTVPEWNNIEDRDAQAHVVKSLFYDRANVGDLGTISLFPVPIDGSLIIETWEPSKIPTFAALSTSNDLPDGYARAMVAALALELCEQHRIKPQPALVQAYAEAMAALRQLNEEIMGKEPPAGYVGTDTGLPIDQPTIGEYGTMQPGDGADPRFVNREPTAPPEPIHPPSERP